MTLLAQAISRALIHFVWQGALAGLLLRIVFFALKKRSANTRYIAACAALGTMSVLPVLTAWFLYVHASSAAAMVAASGMVSPIAITGMTALHFTQAAWMRWLQQLALPLWAAGVFLFSLRLAFGYQHATRLRRRGKPAGDSIVCTVGRLLRSMGVRRHVRVLISALTETPAVVGWLRPVILLPAATLVGLTPLQLEAVLAHEIGHIRRFDYLINLIQMTVETLLFYHPAVWWTSRRIRIERELCCDDLAVQFSGNALRYAKALITLEKMRSSSPAVAMASTGGPLLYRIQRLAGLKPGNYGTSRLPVLFTFALCVMCMALGVTWVRGQDSPGVHVDLVGSSVIYRSPVPPPERFKKEGVTGDVQLEVTLNDAGNVSDAHVLSGPQELRKSSIESVLNWHFTKDADKGTRIVTISYTDGGRRVQINEPSSTAPATAWVTESAAESFTGLTRRQELEREIQDVKKQAYFAENSSASESERAALKLRIAQLQRTLIATPFEGGGRRVLAKVAGLPIKAIAVFGLTEAAKDELLSRMLLRIGDTLSPQALETARQAVRDYDEHLAVSVLPTFDSQVEIRIGLDKRERAEAGEARQ